MTIFKAMRLVSAMIAAVILASASLFGAPRMTMPETSFDFGFTPQNSTISHKFWIISSGQDTLKILKVVPG